MRFNETFEDFHTRFITTIASLTLDDVTKIDHMFRNLTPKLQRATASTTLIVAQVDKANIDNPRPQPFKSRFNFRNQGAFASKVIENRGTNERRNRDAKTSGLRTYRDVPKETRPLFKNIDICTSCDKSGHRAIDSNPLCKGKELIPLDKLVTAVQAINQEKSLKALHHQYDSDSRSGHRYHRGTSRLWSRRLRRGGKRLVLGGSHSQGQISQEMLVQLAQILVERDIQLFELETHLYSFSLLAAQLKDQQPLDNKGGQFDFRGTIRSPRGCVVKADILVNTGGSERSFVDKNFAKHHQLEVIKLDRPAKLRLANDGCTQDLTHAALVDFNLDSHRDQTLAFLTTLGPRVPFIVGMPWLEDHNPSVEKVRAVQQW